MILALLALALSDVDSACRVTTRPSYWDEARVMAPYTDPDPLLVVGMETCVAGTSTVRVENRSTLPGTFTAQTSATFRFSFDPAHTLTFQEFDLVFPEVSVPVGPYDGVTDFGGTSGATVTVQATDGRVNTIFDPVKRFFRAPWLVFIDVTPHFSVQGPSPMTAQNDQEEGAALGAFWNEIPTW